MPTRLLRVALSALLLILPSAAAAQPSTATTWTDTITTNGDAVILNNNGRNGTATIEISGTWTGTISFFKHGTTYTAVTCTGTSTDTSTTTNGTWVCPASGWDRIKAEATAAWTGTAVVRISYGPGGGSSTTVSGGAGDASAANQTTEITRLTSIRDQTDGLEASVDGIEALIGTTNTNTGNAVTSLQALDNAIGTVAPGTAATASLLAGGVYNATPPTLTDGQQASLQFTSAGALIVSGGAGGGGDASAANQTTMITALQIIDNLPNTIGSTTSGQFGALALTATTTAAPTYTTGQSNPLSTDVNGSLRTVVGAGSAQIGSVSVSSVVPGVGATNLAKLEDNPAASGDVGVAVFGQVQATLASSVSADGDYGTIKLTSTGAQWVEVNASALPTGAATAANQSTMITALQLIDNLPNTIGSTTSGQSGALTMGAVTTAAPTYTTAQTHPLSLTTGGLLRVAVEAGGAGGTVDTEFPAAAALSDNFANPTTTSVFALMGCWDGATWDRCTTTSDAVTGTAVPTGGPLSQRVYSDFDGSALPTLTNVDTEGEAVPAAASIKGVQYMMLVSEDGALERGTTTTPLIVGDGAGALNVIIDSSATLTVASHAVTNAGTFAAQIDGAALTALQLIDDAQTGDSVHYRTSAGTTEDEHEIKATAGRLFSVAFSNTNAAARYVRCYNLTAANTTPGTSTVFWGLAIPGNTAGAGFTHTFGPNGMAFSTALTCAFTTGVADTDVNEVAANEIKATYTFK